MPVYVFGDVHAVHSAASSLHSKVAPVSVAVNENVALLEYMFPLGPLVIDVFGATVSTVHVRVAGDASTLPTPSFARTEKVCEPFAKPEYDFGEVHTPHAPASSLHSNDPASDAANANDAEVVLTRPLGPAVTEVSGAVRSTVHARSAGEASTFPLRSTARTANVCTPSARPE